MQHTLSAVAPAGTANVTVRITMLNGVLNPDVDPQSMFVDFFELTAAAGAGGAGGSARACNLVHWRNRCRCAEHTARANWCGLGLEVVGTCRRVEKSRGNRQLCKERCDEPAD